MSFRPQPGSACAQDPVRRSRHRRMLGSCGRCSAFPWRLRRHAVAPGGRRGSASRECRRRTSRAGERLCGAVVAQVIIHHPLGKAHAIRPGQGVPTARHLLTRDGLAGSGNPVDAASGKLGDEAGLAAPGPPSRRGIGRSRCILSLGKGNAARRSGRRWGGSNQRRIVREEQHLTARQIHILRRRRARYPALLSGELVEPRGVEPLTS